MKKQFDLICIGSSAAAMAAARHAINYNKSVCVINQRSHSWVNQEIIERKLLYFAIKALTHGISGAEYGVWTEKHEKKINKLKFDIKVYNERLKITFDSYNKFIEKEYAKLGILLFNDSAKFIENGTIKLNKANLIFQGNNFLIAVEDKKRHPRIKGVKKCIYSLRELEEIPKSFLVIGDNPLGI